MNGWQAAATLELKQESITAVSFAHSFLDKQDGVYVLALGTERGSIKIYQLHKGQWQLRCELEKK